MHKIQMKEIRTWQILLKTHGKKQDYTIDKWGLD